MSRDPLVDMRDREDQRVNYMDGYRTRPADEPKPYSPAAVTWRDTIGSGDCWCGEKHCHDWPGKADGAPHPPKSVGRRVPPEVVLDYHRQQVLAKTGDGEEFRQYLLCSGGCGYLIGCGDSIAEIAHVSCSELSSSRLANRETTP